MNLLLQTTPYVETVTKCVQTFPLQKYRQACIIIWLKLDTLLSEYD